MIQRPKGCNDIYGREAKIWKYVESIIDATMEKYNYTYIRTPIFESTELFHRGIGESTDIVTKETYDFVDRGGRNMTLRPEGTAGVCRSYVENKMYGDPNQPVKVYYNGTMYRYERPQSGRDRELTQFGMEVLGSDDPLTDAEVISLAVNIYKMLGLKEIKVNINSLGDKESRDHYREALVQYFKPHIQDLCEDCQARLEKNPLRILDCKVDKDNPLLKNAPKIIDYLNDESKERFDKVKEYLDLLQVKYEVDPNVVRGLDYYNHTVFVVRALELEEIKLPIVDSIDLFLMYVNEDEKKYAAYLSQELRMAGFIVDTEYTGRSLKAQFKQADRLNAKFIAVLNSEDLNNNEIKIKNNKTKQEEIISLDVLIYYLDEQLNTGVEEEYDNFFFEKDECHCEDDHHDCDCGNDCHCHYDK